MGWNDTTPKDKQACSMSSLELKTETCLPVSEICSDGIDSDKQYALSSNGGTTVIEEITPTDLTEVNDAIAANAAAIAVLEGINPVVDTEVTAGSSDILVTYLDGTAETLDLPEFSASTDASGNVVFDLNGTPFGPFDPAPDEDTFATSNDNGDGTITVTYADGSTATFATGPHEVDTNTTYSFVTNTDGSITITGSDGSVFTGPPATVDTDTDTFATLSGQTITFADGSTLTVPVANESTMARNSDGSITHTSDTGTTFDINVDGTKTTAAALTPTDYGLSRNVNKARVIAAPYADITAPSAATGDVSYSSMERVFTNRAVEQDVGARGVMNTDGTLGNYSKVIADALPISDAFDNNDSFKIVNIVRDATYSIGEGRYVGQKQNIYWGRVIGGNDDSAEMFVDIAVTGSVLRNTNHEIADMNNITSGENAVVRSGEIWQMVWTNNRWRIQATFRQFFGAGWRENEDGTATVFGQASHNVPNGYIDAVLPVTLAAPVTQNNVQITDMFNGVAGQSLNDPEGAAYVFVNDVLGNTPTTIMIGARLVDSNFTGTPRGVLAIRYHIQNAKLDYATL